MCAGDEPNCPEYQLPFLLRRVEYRLRHVSPGVRGRQLKLVTSYLRENFYLTSGAFRTQALMDTIFEVGSDQVLFSSTTLTKRCRSS
jgi:gamma-resorcylate decarboxylase